VIALLDDEERRLAKTADRLDGAGLWAVAQAVQAAQEKILRLAQAIEDQEPGS
jgi:hypothetical protein